MNTVSIINKKREKQELSREELDFIFNGYLSGSVKDYQMSSLLMAICINGMTTEETIALTKAMQASGKTYKYDFMQSDNMYDDLESIGYKISKKE